MKKLILILLLFAFTYPAESVVRVKYMNQSQSQVIIQNYAGFPFSYDQFQLSVNNQLYVLAAILVSGTLVNMAINGTAVLSLPLPPESLAGASVSIWYPGSLPGAATTGNLVDFLQYGSAGNPYETVAVQAGTWTAGAFIASPFPIVFNGGISDYGTNFYGTFVGVDDPAYLNAISVFPNPCIDYTLIHIPNEILISETIVAEIFNAEGKLVDIIEDISEANYYLNTGDLQRGVYYVKLMNSAVEVKTLTLVKH